MILTVFFVLFLGLPVIRLLWRSFSGEDGGVTLSVYQSVFQQKKFGQALGNSFLIAALAAGLATIVAFILAYTCYLNIPEQLPHPGQA